MSGMSSVESRAAVKALNRWAVKHPEIDSGNADHVAAYYVLRQARERPRAQTLLQVLKSKVSKVDRGGRVRQGILARAQDELRGSRGTRVAGEVDGRLEDPGGDVPTRQGGLRPRGCVRGRYELPQGQAWLGGAEGQVLHEHAIVYDDARSERRQQFGCRRAGRPRWR